MKETLVDLNRRTLLGMLGTLPLIARSDPALADFLSDYWPKARQIFTRRWYGNARTQTSAASLVLEVGLAINVSEDRIFWGTQDILSRWEGETYRASYNVSGDLWSSEREIGLTIGGSSLRSADSLPSDLYWQALTGALAMSREQGTEDQYILGGILRGSVDGAEFGTQLSDHYDG